MLLSRSLPRTFRLLFLFAFFVAVPAQSRADNRDPIDAPWVWVADKGWQKDVLVPLGYRVWLGQLGGPAVFLKLTDDTNVGFYKQTGYETPRYVQKRKGLLSQGVQNVLTPLPLSTGERIVSYVDDLKAAHGYAKLRIEAPRQ